MDIEQMKEELRQHLKESRYQHSIGVEEVSHDLAVIYGCDVNKACIAGILHDSAKNLTGEELMEECKKYHLSVNEVEAGSEALLHAKVGAVYAKKVYGVEDEEILNAIIFHTTGRPGMTLLEKIIFTADYIEPSRRFLPSMDKIRWAAYEELDRAVAMILKSTLDYLESKGSIIDPLTRDTFEYYKKHLIC